MRRAVTLFLIAATALLAGCASTPEGSRVNTITGELPPLIDRALFFGNPEISGAQLSPDGQFLAFIKPHEDVRNIWVKRLDEGWDEARPVTADERPVPGYFWSQDGRFLLYVQDKGGNENWNIYAVDPAAGSREKDAYVIPPARNLTDVDGVQARIYSVPENRPGVIIVGLNDRDASFHDVYEVDIATGERTLLIENTEQVAGYMFDLDGRVRLAIRQTEDGGQEILRVDQDGLVPIYTTTYEEDASPIRFHRDNRHFYMSTNKGEDVDLSRLVLMNPNSGEITVVESDPENQVDFGGAVFDESSNELIATYYAGDRFRVYAKTPGMRRDLELLRLEFGEEVEFGIHSMTEDMTRWLVTISSDVDPGSTYLYKRDEGKFELLYRSRPDLPTEHLAFMEPVRYTARDGLEIPAYLTLPRGIEPKNLPVVIHPHGGPWARDYWGYDPYPQFLANRGYAVLQPNFRSSEGYGKAFLHAGDRTWGTGAMQHDISDGVQWLIDQGIADPERVCIFGGSYGGYATLAGVTFTPDLYTCGIPYVAPSNIITLIESFPAYWRPFLKGTWFKTVGDPDVPADRADLAARSPINFVDSIKVPLLVVHGANDPRVKQFESDRIVAVLRDKGMPVEYLVAPDEGHGFRAPDNRMALAVAMERFLAKHLGGRVQQDVPADIAATLDELTVDVSTLETPDLAAMQAELQSAMASELPGMDGGILVPISWQYGLEVDMMGQTMEMSLSRVLEEAEVGGRAAWRITDTATTPMGESRDAFDVDRATLLPIERHGSGMGSMDLVYTDEAITGTLAGMGGSLDVNIPLDAPVIGDGPGMVIAVAGLPLGEGFEAVLRYLEPTSQKVVAYTFAVTGAETVTTPAGTFETWVVEYTPMGDGEGGGVMKVLKDAPHWVVWGEYALPASMGGGTVRSQLEARAMQ